MMEAALVRCNNHHQETPGDTPQSRLQTNRQMASVYHDFALSLLTAGNIKEAGQFRVLQKDRQRLILMLERNYFPAFLYQIWRFTSNYRESHRSMGDRVPIGHSAFFFRVLRIECH
jgi:hypothetical protein